jgi:hypothetical protein
MMQSDLSENLLFSDDPETFSPNLLTNYYPALRPDANNSQTLMIQSP